MASSSASRSFSWSTLSTDFYYRPQAEISSFGTYRVVTVHPGEYHDAVRCSLAEVSLRDTSVKFVALSYCWNSSAAEQTIWCDGRPLKVTANLFAALRNARPTNSDVRLWIDQVCVDQGNIIDRNEQVSKMGHIYRAASGVIVWLGDESPGSSAAMELPREIRRYWPSLYDNPNELTDPRKTPPECDGWGEGAWPAFVSLLARPWWKRLWVIQEVVCAREIMITCGTAAAPWDDFIKLVQVIDSMRHLSAHYALGSKTAAQYIGFMQELRSITEQGTKQAVKDYASEDSMAPYVLRMAKDCEASDHRDKLFAFHHLVRLWNRPDYALEIETLYTLFAAQYLQRIAYAITEFSCDEVKLSQRQIEFVYSAGLLSQSLKLPSWVPDWSVSWKTRPLWLNTECYSAGGSHVKEISPVLEDRPDEATLCRLPLTVKMFDRVLGTGPEALQLSSSNPQALSEALRTWLFQSMSLLHMHRSRPSPYADQTAAVARVVTVDQDQGKRLGPDGALKVYEALLEFLRISDLEDSPRSGRVFQDYERFYSSIASFLRGRVFFITEKGSFGLAQAGIAWGDTVAVVSSAPVPVILRPTINTGPLSREYRLLCEAFVLDIMDGELWENADVPTEDIQLL